jgi:hypothetical protein
MHNNLISKTVGKYHFDRLDINGMIILQWIERMHSPMNIIFICLVTQIIGGLN